MVGKHIGEICGYGPIVGSDSYYISPPTMPEQSVFGLLQVRSYFAQHRATVEARLDPFRANYSPVLGDKPLKN